MSLDPKVSRAVLESYSRCFHLVTSLQQPQRLPIEDAEKMRQWVEQQLLDEKRRLIAAGLAQNLVEEVQLPVVALLDETAAKQQAFRDLWQPLSLTMYGHHTLGHQVFEHLSALRRDPATPVEVLTLYARALAWGLQGEFAPDRLQALEQLRRALQDELRLKAGTLPPMLPPISDGKAVAAQWVLRHSWSLAALILTLLLGFGAFQLAFTLLASRSAETLDRVADKLDGVANQRAQ